MANQRQKALSAVAKAALDAAAKNGKSKGDGPQTLVAVLIYRAPPEDANLNELTEQLTAYGSLEIVDVSIEPGGF